MNANSEINKKDSIQRLKFSIILKPTLQLEQSRKQFILKCQGNISFQKF